MGYAWLSFSAPDTDCIDSRTPAAPSGPELPTHAQLGEFSVQQLQGLGRRFGPARQMDDGRGHLVDRDVPVRLGLGGSPTDDRGLPGADGPPQPHRNDRGRTVSAMPSDATDTKDPLDRVVTATDPLMAAVSVAVLIRAAISGLEFWTVVVSAMVALIAGTRSFRSFRRWRARTRTGS